MKINCRICTNSRKQKQFKTRVDILLLMMHTDPAVLIVVIIVERKVTIVDIADTRI